MNIFRYPRTRASTLVFIAVAQALSIAYGQVQSKELQMVFFSGDGLGNNREIDLRADGNVVLTSFGCIGEVLVVHGKQIVNERSISLVFDGEQQEDITAVLLAWGERMYLVPQHDILGFCNEINLGFEPRESTHGKFPLRNGDWRKKAGERVDLPVEFQKFILPAPVSGTISVVDPSKGRVLIDLGKLDHVFPGMLLTVAGDRQRPSSEIVVESVQLATSIARRTNEADVLSVGQRVCSSFFETGKSVPETDSRDR